MNPSIYKFQTEDCPAIVEIINYNILNSTALYDYNIRSYEQQKNILEEKSPYTILNSILMKELRFGIK